jgi:Mg-chelatase subunit ChlD
MRTYAVLLAMIGAFTVMMGPAIGFSIFPETQAQPAAADVSSICAQEFAQAGADGVVSPKSSALDAAVRSCASVDDWLVAARLYPAAIGDTDPRRILSMRCRDRSAGLGRFATCRDLGEDRLPEPEDGSLTILAPTGPERAAIPPGVGVEIILDTSGSMLEKVHGRRRIDVAKESLATVVRDALADGLLVAIRTFHSTDEAPDVSVPDAESDRGAGRRGDQRARGGDSDRARSDDGRRGESGGYDPSRCQTELTVPVAPLDRTSMLALVERLEAGKRTSTPIAASLAAVADDLAGLTGRRTIVLVTDGDETCGGDPIAEIERLRAMWPDLSLNVVGIALDDAHIVDRMARLAEAGGGGFFDASNADELVSAMDSAITGRVTVGTRVRITSEDGDVIERGAVGGKAIEIAPGTYEVTVMSVPPIVFGEVLVGEGERIELAIPEAA